MANVENNAGVQVSRRELLIMAGSAAVLAVVGRNVQSARAHDASPSPSPDITITGDTLPSLSPEAVHLDALRIESPEVAAERFGADRYSSNPDNWEINEWGGAHLKETEEAVRVNTAGAVFEGWIKSNMILAPKTERAIDALTIVVDPSIPMVETNGGTFWDFGPENSRAGFAQVLGQVWEKEPREQPGVTVIPLCADLLPTEMTGVPVNPVGSVVEAAKRFGADRYSSNPDNWEINEWGGAHLIDNPKSNASLVNLDGASLEGWIKAKKVKGRDAVTFVVHPNVGQARVVGGTFWDFVDQDGGFQQILGQVIDKESKPEEEGGQPDVTVYPAYNCVNTAVVEK